MKILHICLSCFYIDDQNYQENELPRENKKQGHDVYVLASTHINLRDGKWGFAQAGEYKTPEGVNVQRIPYHPWTPDWLGIRLRIHLGVFEILKAIDPDVILFHGITGWELRTVARYKRYNPNCVVYADHHGDRLTSGSNWFTRFFLHYVYYRSVVKSCVSSFEKVLCISPMTLEYARDFYGIAEEELELYPLGGYPIEESSYASQRLLGRAKYGISENEILIVQTGKQYKSKGLIDALRALSEVDATNLRFIIGGVLMDDIRDDATALIAADSRVNLLDWLDSDSLNELLCAADIYLVAGRQTATTQHALCASCAVVLENIVSNAPYVFGNGWLLNDPAELASIFEEISMMRGSDLEEMQKTSLEFAREKLDYRRLSLRYLQ